MKDRQILLREAGSRPEQSFANGSFGEGNFAT